MSSTALATLPLAQTPRRKLAETVAEQILEAIHPLAPGTKLPSESEFMQMLGVGRSTVREALNGLVMLGIIEVRHGAGAFVSNKPRAGKTDAETSAEIAAALTKGVTRELLEAREIVEVAISRLAARRRTDSDLREIESVLEAHKRSLTSPMKPASEFHVLLAEAAHNEVLAGVFRSFLKLMVKRGPRPYTRLKDFAKWELDQHRAIFEAVRAGDAELAAKRMHEHVTAMEVHYRKAGAV